MNNDNNINDVKWRNKPYSVAYYTHFDSRIKLDENNLLSDDVWNYINDKDKVARHGFYPFIYSEQVMNKYSKVSGIKSKVRPICYSAHLDRCIHKYYSYLLNQKYNDYVKEHNIHFNSVAYRDNLHKNNIHFAKQAFDFIRQGECDIFIGDFTSFFDNLDHKYLKQMLCKVLNVKSLPDDWYAVYKNITKYSTFDIIDILKINDMLSEDELKSIENSNTNIVHKKAIELNKNNRFALTKEQFKSNKDFIKPNKKSYGVPQGSSISAILSNIYMIEFDEKIQSYASNLNGLYMRYSDDFIIVIPKNDKVSFNSVRADLGQFIASTKGLSIHKDKRRTYHYKDGVVLDLDKENNPTTSIDYLGFVFDGVGVTIRPKTISKYYTRMYRKLNTIVGNHGETKNGNRISYKNLYIVYTQKGRNGYNTEEIKKDLYGYDKFKNGNFFTYVHKADKIFNSDYDPNDENSYHDPIKKCTARHMLKIRRKRQQIENSK